MPGPVPKRSEDRRRRNTPAAGGPAKAPAAAVVPIPDADPEWHPIASRWFESLKLSGQRRWYEPSDWAVAYLIAESISMDFKPQFVGFAQTDRDQTEAEYAVIPLKGASLSAYLKAMGNLLATEGDRRRASIELQRAAVVDDDEESALALVTDIASKFGG